MKETARTPLSLLDEGDDRQDQEHDEQDLCDRRGQAGQAAEAEDGRDDGPGGAAKPPCHDDDQQVEGQIVGALSINLRF